MTFYQYMKRYEKTDSPRGDLYKDMKRDNTFPKTETRGFMILRYLYGRAACNEAIETFKECFRDYVNELKICK